MSNIIRDQERTEFLVGEVAEAVGDYFVLLKQYSEARAEYNQALNAYELVNNSSSDFDAAQSQKKIVRTKRDELSGQIGVNLSQWFQNTFEVGWQTIDSLLSTPGNTVGLRFASASRSESSEGVRAVKLIDLGGEQTSTPLALINNIKLEPDNKMDILLQLYPTGDRIHLPPDTQLIVLDEYGNSFYEAQARETDNWIELKFKGKPGEEFSVKVALGDASITEHFVI